MSDYAVLEAAARDRAGKGASRAIRRDGMVPGVIYGGGEETILLKMDPRVLNHEMRSTGFFATQFQVDVGGAKHRVLPKEVQFHPVTDSPMHVDFLRVTDRTRVTVDIHVRFENEEAAPGLEEEGGVLNVVRGAVEVITSAGNIPDEIVVDLTGLTIGDGVRMSDITLPEGVKPTITDRDFMIASIAPPTQIIEEEEDEDEEDGDEMDVPTVAEDEAAKEDGEDGDDDDRKKKDDDKD